MLREACQVHKPDLQTVLNSGNFRSRLEEQQEARSLFGRIVNRLGDVWKTIKHNKDEVIIYGTALSALLGPACGKTQEVQLPPSSPSIITVIPTPTETYPSPTINPSETITPTPSAPPTTEPSPPTGEKKFPAEVLKLGDRWKLTLPDGRPGDPTEIMPYKLGTYEDENFTSIVTKEGNAVRFGTPVNGVTTGNSKYPRTELREMNGEEKASWSSTEGTHRMLIKQAIIAIPQTKGHIVAGQIHDEEDDVIVIRLEKEEGKDYSELFVDVDGDTVYVLNDRYRLGEIFTVEFVVRDGKTEVYYNGSKDPVYILEKNYIKAYFKAGAYPQANCETEKRCGKDNHGAVDIYQLEVTHQ